MVTFCLGSARQKREYFYKLDNAVVLDNVEVLFCASENGRNYFAYGAPPFSEFSVRDYLAYRRALIGGFTDSDLLGRFKIKDGKRMGALCDAERRCVAFAEKAASASEKTIVVNLDGTQYSRRNMRALVRLLSECENAFVCVTDKKFVKRSGIEHKILFFGKLVTARRPRFYAARMLARRICATRVAVF